MSNYVRRLNEVEQTETNKLLKERIVSYKRFIEETVKKHDVLSKSFYVVVPFSIMELGVKSADKTMLGFLPKIGNKPTRLPYSKEYIVEKAKAKLIPKRDHIMRLFSRLGLEIVQLNTKEIIQLLYKTYNEETASNQKVTNLNYGSPTVTTKTTEGGNVNG